ncbi:MAG TPA: diacylglycerol kinase family protein [Hyphomicrobiaceae bacterium]|nr:diacylglycerol kinase family protein [Hyphomicrobiaceae bacterium]
MRRRFLLVHNPVAGLKGDTLVDAVVCELLRRGASVAREAGAAPALSAEGYDAVIAAGGDGTIRGLHAALAAGRVPLGIIPAGTGNVFATELGLQRNAAVIADVLIGGPVVEIEGARANGRPFFLMAGAGFDGEVVSKLDTDLKRRFGKLAYAAPLVRALLKKPVDLAVTIDGERHQARWVVAANARHYGGSFVIAPRAGLLMPGLEAVLFKGKSRRTSVCQLLSLAAGRLESEPGVEILSCRRIEVEAAVPVPVEIDGDPFEPTPLAVEAGGPRLAMIVPPEFLSGRAS